MAQKVSDLAGIDTGLGCAPDTDKANLVWEEACENLDEEVTEFCRRVPVSESYTRELLKEMSPGAFGL